MLSSIYPPDGSEEYAYPEELEAGNYYIADQYGVFHVFTTEENLSLHSKLQYDAHNRWITQINAEGVATTLEVKDYRQDNVMYNNDQKDLIVIEKEHFIRLSPTVPSGSIRGIVEFISSFQRLSDSAYEESVARYTLLQQEYQKLENATIDVLGDTYREGWWQSNDYVDGDESKLYADALDN